MAAGPKLEQTLPGAAELVECIHRIGRMLAEANDHDRLLRAILDECRDLMRCEAASIALCDEEAGNLRFIVAAGGSESIVHWPIEKGAGIVGAVAANSTPIVANNVSADARWSGAFDQRTGFETRNLAAVPMRRDGRCVGVLEALNREGDIPFADADLQLLQIFADQAAVVLTLKDLVAANGYKLGVTDIAHSAKNILMSLNAPLVMIDRACEARDWDALREPWGILKRGTSRTYDLVKNMLSYVNESAAVLAPADPLALIRAVHESSLWEARAKNVRLELIAAGEMSVVPLDAELIHQALHNLIGNAIKILVEHRCAEPLIEVGVAREEDAVRFFVRDNGPGLPDCVRQNLFTPWITAGKSKGTGLGLANVKKTADKHNGRVTVESAEGVGTTFHLLISADR